MSHPLTDAADRPTRAAVIVAAKDEAERLAATLEALSSLERVDMTVVVDDGSSDGTSAIASAGGAIAVRHKTNRGKAAAMETGARVVAMRESADLAGGDGDTGTAPGIDMSLAAEPRQSGHTGPLPAINPLATPPRALLFVDADLEGTAANLQPLIDAVLDDGVDMAIALIPPQVTADGAPAGGHGLVVRTARNGIERATGWEPEQPLSGVRCLTREVWSACQPLAPGWGVETSLTIDALDAGFWAKEVPVEIRHRATGSDLRSQLHRAAQLRDVTRALHRRRHLRPEDVPDEDVPDHSEVDAAPRTAADEAIQAERSAHDAPAAESDTPAPTPDEDDA